MDETLQNRLVQVGIVTAADTENHRVRVKFPDTGITSGWLYVLQHPGAVTILPDDGHTGQLASWMPAIGSTVAVLYLPVENGDGFILGVI